MYNPQKHHRRSIRLKGYDYSKAGLYFITLCCQDRRHLFGTVISKQMHYNLFGKIVEDEWLKTPEIRDNIRLHEFIIMPNHFHGILEILFSKGKNEDNSFKSPSQNIGAIIRGFKGATTKRIKELIYQEKEKRNFSTGEPFAPNKSPFAPDTDELPFAPDTGELPFAPDTGELPFAPDTGELPFAPTDKSIWQRNYYEHIIRTERAYKNISNYIINNPANWEKDKFS